MTIHHFQTMVAIFGTVLHIGSIGILCCVVASVVLIPYWALTSLIALRCVQSAKTSSCFVSALPIGGYTAPTSTNTISNWNRTLLIRYGSPPRGFSSHRSGFVSRTCILAILHNKGTELPPGVVDMMVRAGG